MLPVVDYTDVNDLLCGLEIIPTQVWALRSLDFNWGSQAREEAGLDFWKKGPGLVTCVCVLT